MKKLYFLFFSNFIFLAFCFGQTTIKTKEVKINYTDGLDVFNVCINNPQITYNVNYEYFWYNEFTGLKSTKGGVGGNLLHGKYNLYDINGNLINESYYNLGIITSEKKWDAFGNLISIEKYKNNKTIYWKFKDENNWVEWIGQPMFIGSVKKVYDYFGNITEIATNLPNSVTPKIQYKLFSTSSNKIIREYTKIIHWSGSDSPSYVGKYYEYYDNGKPKIEGQFDEIAENIRIGIWKIYNENGTIDYTLKYKSDIQKWENGKLKMAGGYFFNSEENTWVLDGVWKWYSNDGVLLESKTYNRGSLIN